MSKSDRFKIGDLLTICVQIASKTPPIPTRALIQSFGSTTNTLNVLCFMDGSVGKFQLEIYNAWKTETLFLVSQHGIVFRVNEMTLHPTKHVFKKVVKPDSISIRSIRI